MKRFEHTWDTILNYRAIVNHKELIDKRSEEGWELVSVVMLEEQRLRLYRKLKY